MVVTCIWTGGAGGGRTALASASCLLTAVTMTVWAQLLGLRLTVLVAVVSGGYLGQNTQVKISLWQLLTLCEIQSDTAECLMTGSAAPHQSHCGLVFIPFLCCCSSPKSPDCLRTSCGALSADSCLYDSECNGKHRAQVRVKPGTNWCTLSSKAQTKTNIQARTH